MINRPLLLLGLLATVVVTVQSQCDCDATLNVDVGFSGYINSPGGATYPDSCSCTINLVSLTSGSTIELQFTTFDIEFNTGGGGRCANDNVTLVDGNVASVVYCGTGAQLWKSTQDTIRVEFRSNNAITGAGFMAHYEVKATLADPLFFRFGEPYDDKFNQNQDDVAIPVTLATAFTYYGANYNDVKIADNGILSFLSPITGGTPSSQPFPQALKPAIAALWADTELINGGDIYYRTTTDTIDIDHASLVIRNRFGLPTFNAVSLFIATYYEINRFRPFNEPNLASTYNERNTFQAVLVQGDDCAFVILNYLKIDWNQASTMPNPGVVGLDAGDGQQYLLIANGADIYDLQSDTNTDNIGRWVYKTCDALDLCASGNGGCDQICSTDGETVTCSCREGFIPEGETGCMDINECLINNGGCEVGCENTDGSFYCTCNEGYQLKPDGKRCRDTNECQLGTHDCQHLCRNTIGSYTCACNPGYTVNPTNSNLCDDIPECTLGLHYCEQVCIEEEGGFSCDCYEGYSLNLDGNTCEDIDECNPGNGGCSDMCVNDPGSFHCECYLGFRLSGDGLKCEDIDECEEGSDDCEQICIDTAGSYLCICEEGYELNDDLETCTSTNPCLINNGGCQDICTPISGTPSTRVCSCSGCRELENDGVSCADVIAPTIICPDDVVHNEECACDGDVEVCFPPPSATDNCGTPQITPDPYSASSFPEGVTTVTYTATDGAGNTAQCSMTVTVTCGGDNEAPKLECLPDLIVRDCDNPDMIATWDLPVATDNCGNAVTVSCTPASGLAIGCGTQQEVTCTATDDHGHSASTSFTVSGLCDLNPPIITCPADVSKTIPHTRGTTVNWNGPYYSDDCSAEVTCTYSQDDVFACGKTVVTCTATDHVGNTASCSFTVDIDCTCVCDISGDPHYRTFDRRGFNFQGDCSYTLLLDRSEAFPEFRVDGANIAVPNRPRVSVLRSMRIYVLDTKIDLLQNLAVLVNGFAVSLPYVTPTYTIRKRGRRVVFRYRPDTFWVSWNGRNRARIGLDYDMYAGLTRGLCGPCDLDQSNDFTKPDDTEAINGREFGNSWKVDESCPDAEESPECENPTMYEAYEYCGILTAASGPFADCHAVIDPQAYFDDCIYDMCLTGNMRCTHLEEYYADCKDAGVNLGDYRTAENCTLECPPNSHYSDCASPCPQNCAGDDACVLPCVEDCVCDSGYILSGLDCVPASSCGCYVNGQYHGDMTSWLNSDCTETCSCQYGSIICAAHQCHPDAYCDIVDGQRQCVCLYGEDENGQCEPECPVDTTPPMITCPADVHLIDLDNTGEETATFPDPTVNDASDLLTYSCSHTSGSSFPLATTIITCTANDGYGNTATCTFDIVVEPYDPTPPQISCQSSITVDADCSGVVAVTYEPPNAIDDSGIVDVTCSPPSGSIFPAGITTVVCTATDPYENAATCHFSVEVVSDDVPPNIMCPYDVHVCSVDEIDEYIANAVDDSGSVTVTCDPPSGFSFPLGSSTVTCTAVDPCGNIATCSFTVFVDITLCDNEPPVIYCPADQSAIQSSCGVDEPVSYPDPIATDNSGTVYVTCTPVSGSLFPLGTSQVECIAEDPSRNTANCSFDVEIRPCVVGPLQLPCTRNLETRSCEVGPFQAPCTRNQISVLCAAGPFQAPCTRYPCEPVPVPEPEPIPNM